MMKATGLRGTVRKVGNSTAIIVAAADVRRAPLKLGQKVKFDVTDQPEEILGFLQRRGINLGEFRRENEWHDRY